MRVLLDTHAFLWWITDDPKLSLRAGEIIKNMDNEVFVSAASGWELVIKTRIGPSKNFGEPGRLYLGTNPIECFSKFSRPDEPYLADFFPSRPSQGSF